MTENALQKKLQTLKDALYHLERFTLPKETRAALAYASQHLLELEEELRSSQEQNRLAMLYRVSQVLGTTLDLDQVLAQVMDSVIALTGAERGFLVLLEAEEKAWKYRVGRNFSLETLESKDMGISRTVVDTVIETGEGVVTTDALTDPRFARQESVVFYALRSILCAPLLARGQVIGAVYVDNRAQAGMFNEDDLELLKAFAIQAAIVIQNAQLYTRTDQALSQRVAELETLTQIDRELNTRLDLHHVLEITHRRILREARASQAWIMLNTLSDGEDGAPFAYPEALPEAYTLLVRSAIDQLAPRFVPASLEVPARLAVPIVHSGRPIGAILIERSASFSESEARFMARLANRAAAAIENARLYEAVQQANQEKSKFVSVVTHELRIPMTSIKGYADLMRSGAVGPVNEQQISFLDVIRNNVDRMSALVSDLSDISRVETGRLKLENTFFPIHQYVEEVLRSLKPKMEEKQQTLTADIPADLPQVYADRNRFVQVLTNLISNAWKYTPPGGRVRVEARVLGDKVKVSVIDTGIGISPEDQKKLFSQFFRSEDPKVREEQGWGLGLNVTRRLVELMGGTIGFESELGKGSTFWFTLPTTQKES